MQEGIEPTMEVRQAVPLQPFHKAATTRLYRVIDPQRRLVIIPDTLSLFLLSAAEFHVNPLQEIQQAAGTKPIIRFRTHP